MHKIYLASHDVPPSWKAKAAIQKIFDAILESKKPGLHFVSLSVIDAAQMKKLNFKFRKKNKPTDVLSFEQKTVVGTGKSKRYFWGDLVLCAPVVKKQAKQAGHSIQDEVRVLLTHAVLHLMGHDHERSVAEEKKMARLENKILKKAFPDSQKKQRLFSGLLARERLKTTS